MRLLALAPLVAALLLATSCDLADASLGAGEAQAQTSSASRLDWNDDQVRWYGHREGLAHAAANGLDVLYVEYATWCPHCVRASAFFHDPRIVELAKKFVLVRADTDALGRGNERYLLDGRYVPRFVFLDPQGRPRAALTTGQQEFRYFYSAEEKDVLVANMRRLVAARR
ncbi:MAG: thioredoxin family protein [Myxococcota bacterium]